jgi:hypothetical protein
MISLLIDWNLATMTKVVLAFLWEQTYHCKLCATSGHLTLLFRNIDMKIMHMFHSFCVLDTKDETSETLWNKPSKHEKVENFFTLIETSTSHVVLWIPKMSLKDSS